MPASLRLFSLRPNPLPRPLETGNFATLAGTLCELGRVDRLADLGEAGPLMASAGNDSLYHCLFGRDSLRMADDLLDDFPAVARATLLDLARLQGVRYNSRADEEPGRILHEHRTTTDPRLAELGECWDFPYFGSVDATPQWINLLDAYCSRYGSALLDTRLTNRLGQELTVRDSFLAALGWILRRLDDRCCPGYLWVRRNHPHGIPNQVWEDSADSHYHADGGLLDFNRPYVPVAVQGYVFDALLASARLLRARPERAPIRSLSLYRRARDLRAAVLADFWQPDLQTFAQALAVEEDGSLRPVRVVASSPGHLLASRLLDSPMAASQREALMQRLTAEDLLAPAGIRTKSTTAPRFAPGSYHNGSTWPMDTGVIADGLRRHGRYGQAEDLDARVVSACSAVGGFPEFFRADTDNVIRVNARVHDVVQDGQCFRLEQPPQANQGWTATRVWKILRRQKLVQAPAALRSA